MKENLGVVILNTYVKTRIICGHLTKEYIRDFKNKRVLIVCDKFLSDNGTVKYITNDLDKSCECQIFDKVIPDPTLSVVVTGLKEAIEFNPDIVIGFGGGSAIDTAKGIIYFSEETKAFKKPLFITVPTTSGTGSEVTSVTVIKDDTTGFKHILASEEILADVALLDAALTLTVPQKITAYTGLDVLTHALEAFVAKKANSFSDALAEKAVGLLLKSLLLCYEQGSNLVARQTMHEASTLAGIAFNTAGLGLNHSIAHQIGGIFHIPHGQANALLLNEVITINCRNDKAKHKYAKLARRLQLASGEVSDEIAVEVLKNIISIMLNKMDVATKLSELNVSQADFDANINRIAESALNDFCYEYNPYEASAQDVVEILKALY